MPLNITSATVMFENGLKREEFGPIKKASVSLTAAVADGEDGGLVLDGLASTAIAKVAYMLSAPRPEVAAAPAEEKPPVRRGRPPKDQSSGEPAQTAPSNEASSEAPAEPAQEQASPAGDDWSADAGEEAVTDQEILSATSAKAQALGKRDPIIALIQTFNTKPAGQAFKVQEIPAEQRRDYLAKLAALT